MGFNPFRKQDKTLTDVVMVVLALAATIALVIWAVLPR
jgi:hypothetical protein